MNEDAQDYLKRVKAEDIKTFFDWLMETHQNTIRADSSLGCSWRVLVRHYVNLTGQLMDENMKRDVIRVRSYALESHTYCES